MGLTSNHHFRWSRHHLFVLLVVVAGPAAFLVYFFIGFDPSFWKIKNGSLSPIMKPIQPSSPPISKLITQKINLTKIKPTTVIPLKNKIGSKSTARKVKLSIRRKNKRILEKLSEKFQTALAAIQNPLPSCSNLAEGSEALLCGHSHTQTGIGAQIQHRMGCLMMSMALKIPLINDEHSYWTFHEPWRKYLKPFGTKCPAHSFSKILYWDWVDRRLFEVDPIDFEAHHQRMEEIHKDWVESFEFPLTDGILVPWQLALAVERHHSNPFLWFVGQFNKAVFGLKNETLVAIEQSKISLGISRQQLKAHKGILIGIHARRTDKVEEVGEYVETKSFMKSVVKYLNRVRWNRTTTPLAIFVATEDCDVITEFRMGFPDFESYFVTFCEKTRATFDSRRDDLFGILRDISILADADYVICTYSSNVGRTVLELRSWRHDPPDPNPETKILSLHRKFSFELHWDPIKQQKLVPVDEAEDSTVNENDLVWGEK